MSRQKGQLNKRTRLALSAASEGKLAEDGEKTLKFLLAMALDRHRDDNVRLQAANVVLPYLCPKLSAVEQTIVNDKDQESHEDIMARLSALVAADPELIKSLVKANPELRRLLIEEQSSHEAILEPDSDRVLQ